MLARVLAMALCLSVSVCLSQVGVLSKRMNESSWVLVWELPSTYPAVLKRNSGIFNNKGTSLWKFIQNSGLRKFCFGTSIVERVVDLARRKVDAPSVINWTVVGQLS